MSFSRISSTTNRVFTTRWGKRPVQQSSIRYRHQELSTGFPYQNVYPRTQSNRWTAYPEFYKCISIACRCSWFRRWHQELEAQEPILVYPQRCLCWTWQSLQGAGNVPKPITWATKCQFLQNTSAWKRTWTSHSSYIQTSQARRDHSDSPSTDEVWIK